MQIQPELVPATIKHKPIIARLMQFYLYDGSIYSGRDLDEDGYFGYRYLDHYWEEPERFAYLFRVDGKWAGFGLINSYVMLQENSDAQSLAEFFVMRKYRRSGIGRIAFQQLMARHPGRWEIRVEYENTAGLAFWPVVIDELTGGNYQCIKPEPTVWEGPIYSFDCATETKPV